MNCSILYFSNDRKHVAACESIPLIRTSATPPFHRGNVTTYVAVAPVLTLTLNLLTTTIVARPSNVSKWQMGFNSAFKGLIQSPPTTHQLVSCTSPRKNGAHSFVIFCAPLAAKRTK